MIITGKRALVLGAARGIGLAIARTLASQGVGLILPWFDWPESVAALEREFGGGTDGRDGQHLLMRADLRQPDEVAALMAAIDDRFGGLEIVVNNIERGGIDRKSVV
jgi:3-oxoacyl-[acyl-carrier protein] reductase